MARLKSVIRQSIRELIEDYEDHEFSYLTEREVVASLLSGLRTRMDPIAVHCEVRPYDDRGKVISGEPLQWMRKKGGGCTVDLAIVHKRHLRQTVRKTNRRYWRCLSFPVEAIRAAVEVKVRVWQNKRNIRPDIDKLHQILKANPKCFTYLVVLDRCASQSDLKKLHEYALRFDVGYFSYPLCEL